MVPQGPAAVHPQKEGQSYDQAVRFIAALTGDSARPATFQTFSDGTESNLAPLILHAPIGEAWPRLVEAQAAGHGVFVMVNEGDGRGRTIANVTALRALFADADGELVPAARMRGAPPSLVVRSGHGEHYYWLLEPGAEPALFTPAQAALAKALGTDPKVKDLARVLRLPGTLNLKDPASPRRVELVTCEPSRRYALEDVLLALDARPAAVQRSPELGPVRLVPGNAAERARAYAAQIVAFEGQGGDDATYQAACAIVRDFGLPPAVSWELLQEWNQTNASPPWPEAKLRAKWNSARNYGKKPMGSKLAEQISAAIDVNAAQAVKEKLTTAEDPRLDPSRYCYDPSQRGRPWRLWRAGRWMDGISGTDLERLLENEAELSGRAIKAWQKRVTVVDHAGPVYSSSERIARLEDGTLVANTFRRPALEPAPGNCEPVLEVLRNLAGGEGDAFSWLRGWLAKLTQNVYAGRPARIGVAPVLQGPKGSGKGVLEEVTKALLGPWNVASITQRELSSDFNSYLDGVLLVYANEVWSSDQRGTALLSRLKDHITCHERLINKKGVAEIARTAVENWILASNSHRPVEVERGDRRFTVIRTGAPIAVDLGAQVADDARAGGPLIRAFLAHLLSIPASELVRDYRPLETAAKEEVARASGNAASKYAHDIARRGFFSVTPPGLQPRDLYLAGPDGLRSVSGVDTPVVTSRKLMELFRAYASEIGAPAQQATTLLAALREEIPLLWEGELLVEGRRERVLAGLPGMLPESSNVVRAPPERPLPQQGSLRLGSRP